MAASVERILSSNEDALQSRRYQNIELPRLCRRTYRVHRHTICSTPQSTPSASQTRLIIPTLDSPGVQVALKLVSRRKGTGRQLGGEPSCLRDKLRRTGSKALVGAVVLTCADAAGVPNNTDEQQRPPARASPVAKLVHNPPHFW